MEDLPRDRNRDDHHQAGQVRRQTCAFNSASKTVDLSELLVFELNNRMCDLLQKNYFKCITFTFDTQMIPLKR